MPVIFSYVFGFGVLLSGYAWLCADHFRPWVNFHAEALACAGAALLFCAWVGRSARPLIAPYAALAIAAISVIPWLQVVTGIEFFIGDATVLTLYFLIAAASCSMAFGQQFVGDHNERILETLRWTGLLCAAVGLLQWFALTGSFGMLILHPDVGDRALGNMGQPNQLATFLLMSGVLWVAKAERRGLGVATACVVVAFMTITLVMAQSRSAVLSAIVVVIFLAWKSRYLNRSLGRASVVWLSLLAGLTMMFPWFAQSLLMGAPRAVSSGQMADRIEIYSQVIAGILSRPWTGFGWNQTAAVQAAGAVQYPGSLTYTNAHNVLLDLLSWNGLPLGLLLIAAAGYWLVSRMRRVRSGAGVMAMAALLPLAVHSMTEYPFAYAYFLIFAAMLVGLVEAECEPQMRFSLSRRVVMALVVAWAVTGVYLCYEYFLVEEDFRVVRFENLRIGKTPDVYEAPEIHLLTQMRTMLQAARMVPKPGMLPEDIEALRKATLRFAYGPLSHRYALALALNGDPNGASRQLVVFKSTYGAVYYGAVKEAFFELQRDKYPELGKVQMP